MAKKARPQYDNQRGRKSMRYGCMDCADSGSCKLEDQCRYAVVLDNYESYWEYLMDKDPILVDNMDAKSRAKSQKWEDVHMILKNLDTGETYRHALEAAEKLGCAQSNIYNHLCGMYSHIHGFHLAWVPA